MKTHTTGVMTFSTRGISTPLTVSEVHGTGAATMIHGTAAHGIGTHGRTIIGDITDGTTHGTTEDSGIHGTTEAATDGIHIGVITITTTTLPFRSTMKTDGTVTADRPGQTECSQAGYPQEEALPAPAG